MINQTTNGTKCPKCEHDVFEFAEDKPNNSTWVVNYLRCAKCKTFLALTSYANTNVLIEELQKDINKLKTFFKIQS